MLSPPSPLPTSTAIRRSTSGSSTSAASSRIASTTRAKWWGRQSGRLRIRLRSDRRRSRILHRADRRRLQIRHRAERRRLRMDRRRLTRHRSDRRRLRIPRRPSLRSRLRPRPDRPPSQRPRPRGLSGRPEQRRWSKTPGPRWRLAIPRRKNSPIPMKLLHLRWSTRPWTPRSGRRLDPRGGRLVSVTLWH